jgi:hypothetical protein
MGLMDDRNCDGLVPTDPVVRLICTGRAKDFGEAEELCLTESMP